MPRPLTEDERKLLIWILEHGSERARNYLPQLEGIGAQPSCDCGCTSIKLFPSGKAIPAEVGTDRILCDLVGLTRGGDSILLILFQDDGRLSELEIAPFQDFESNDPDRNFPDMAGLRFQESPA